MSPLLDTSISCTKCLGPQTRVYSSLVVFVNSKRDSACKIRPVKTNIHNYYVKLKHVAGQSLQDSTLAKVLNKKRV